MDSAPCFTRWQVGCTANPSGAAQDQTARARERPRETRQGQHDLPHPGHPEHQRATQAAHVARAVRQLLGAGRGLTPFGRELVAEMEALRMVVDLAHVNAAGVDDALGAMTRPFVVSHSACHAVHAHPRNLSDDQLQRIAERGGVAAGALYRHFPSKAELFVEVFRSVAEQELADLYEASSAPGTTVDKLDAIVREFTGNALAQPRLAWALGYEPVDPLVDAERLAYRQTYRERLAELLRRGIEAGELPEQDAELAAASLIGAISEALVNPLSPVRSERASDEQTIAAISAFCRRAVGA